MGTPDFAVPSLEALYQNGFDVSLVATQPDRPKGRGRRRVSPPVKTAAEAFGYRVIQPESIRSDAVQDTIQQIYPELIIVVAFGQLLPQRVLAIPSFGAVNVHASLLPKYRGPAPIQWAIIHMETETGVTTIRMDEGMDTGDILLSEKISIRPQDTSGTLHDRLAHAGAALLVKTLRGIESKTLEPVPQDHTQATYAPMLRKKDGQIDWSLPADRIEAFIRGMTPWPGAHTFLGDKRFKLFAARVLETDRQDPPGTVVRGFPDELRVATGKGLLSILEIQAASGKRMPVKTYLRGDTIPVGSVFS